ncbi:uncharacterized protein GLRG_02873 [Colletotrichum graminicola M1.001]|uniref:Uncharacterized protein n=1 Tax=Colletotrichum graminicola (strain M1.001 / M2 / FGSC 10212) TaxID=645133 RepID=E3QA41_COLGM|nr:uncharacterized protein GLRG_02873 [Colletotrichum graminicola M1.001]EFQ27729.1 hypothetical protein GLRG_02873 [Colletotrichum graminicola M1.001]
MSAFSMLGSGVDILGMSPAEFYCLLQKDVERELERHFPQYIDNESLLDIYTKWLVFQIPNLGHRSHEDSSETIRRGCDYLSSRNYKKGLVLSAFSRHKNCYIRGHPEATRRRANLAIVLILTALFRTILILILVETTFTVLMIFIAPAKPVAPIFRFIVMNQIARIIRNARTGVYPRTMTMTHGTMSLHIAVIDCIVANLQVAGMSHAAASRRLAPMDHAKPLIRIILTDRGVGRKRSDGRLSPWDDIHPPPKKPRQQDAWEGGLPWDDFEAPRENNKRDSADSAAAKHVIAIDHEPAPIDNSKKAVASLGVAKAAGEPTEAEWEQAGIEANAFLEALGRELAECPELETSANLRNQGNSDSPTYSSASPVSSACQYHSPANSVPDDDEDSFMDDVLDDIAEPTRSKGCKIDEDQPCSDPVIIPYQTLKSLQRDPPYDSDVLNLFRCKRDSHVYINVARRRNAVDFYTETEEERATVSMSNLAV